MKISGGKHKNRNIIASNEDGVRPTTSKNREVIVNLLLHGKFKNHEDYIDKNECLLRDSNILDIFAGSGVLGIELLSHGANHVTFIDINPRNISLIKKNINNIGESDNVNYIVSDSTKLPIANDRYSGIPVDVVLMDAPYNANLSVPALKSLIENGWLKNGAILIVETSKSDDLLNIPECYKILDIRKKGKTKLWILQFSLTS